MYGDNKVGGQSIIAKQVLPSPSLWVWVKSETVWVHWKVFMLQEGYCMHSSMQMLRTLLWALQSSSYSNVVSLGAALKLKTLLSCSMHNTTSTELSIIMYCMLLWYTIGIIVLHIHTRVGTCSSFNDPVAIMVIPDTVWRHFWCDLQ